MTPPSTLARIIAGSVAGIAAAGAYMVEQAIDLRIFGHATDDRVLLGRLVTGNNDVARPLGLAMHLANGAIAGVIYVLVAEPVLPGPPLARGVTFIMVENCILYPLARFEELHPAIRDGSLSSYWTPAGCAQQLLRHIAFGVVLGPVAARMRCCGHHG